MQNYQLQLKNKLFEQGWEVSEITTETEWFAAEHWKITSFREGYGQELFVSFMCHLSSYGEMYAAYCKKKYIQCIKLSKAMPTQWFDVENITEMSMSKGHFGENLEAFLLGINEYRNDVHLGTIKQEA